MKIVLASASPRRKELMKQLEVPFEVIISEVEEDIKECDPVLLTEKLSWQKAMAVCDRIEREGLLQEDFCVIGADTVVFSGSEKGDAEILGKPADREDARRMITKLAGNVHTVCTGVTLLVKRGKEKETVTFSEQTKVFVAEMSREEIEHYLDTGEPYDKAGGYGIQGLFSKFVEKIDGDYFNVVGLPVHHLYRAMKQIQ